MFIKLTLFVGYNKVNPPTKPVYVNFDLVSHFTEYRRKINRYDLEPLEGRVQQTELTTVNISFAAGLSEEFDSIDVMESMDDVLRELNCGL